MKTARNQITILILMILLYGCKGLYQNEYLFDKGLIDFGNESGHLGYKLYKTGIDNYRFDFYGIKLKDTTNLFSGYLNDAVYSTADFETEIKNDSIFIKCSMDIGSKSKIFDNKIIVLIKD